MEIMPPLPEDKKLTVVSRIEPGCLGPEGKDHVDEFCRFAQKEADLMKSDFIRWVIVPRHDKSQPETQYEIGNKNLARDKAARYLAMLEASLDAFENNLDENLGRLIERYLGR